MMNDEYLGLFIIHHSSFIINFIKFNDMSHPVFQNCKEQIIALEITTEQKALLLRHFKQAEREYDKADFVNKRMLKDKEISISILNATVDELQMQQRASALQNEQLEQQRLLSEKQAEQLERNLHALEMSYTEMEQFAYIASHDLKSPLRSIGSYAQLLKRKYRGKLDGTADEFIDFIVNGAQHMNEIITDLLEYARVDREKEMTRTDFNRLMELICINLNDVIQTSGAQITVDQLPILMIQKSATIQLLQNLIENAIKFRGEACPKIHVSARPLENDKWEFSVTDNGIGIDENYQQKAFQPFQRLGQRNLPGLGIGLAICKKVAKLHKGDIWFRSIIGSGTTFCFTIPQKEVTLLSSEVSPARYGT
jgi:light-regulated signal transduction histidine kinase (bacteriophytochrome)